jgi:RimJ/RimL family protein N-acetyltransferase
MPALEALLGREEMRGKWPTLYPHDVGNTIWRRSRLQYAVLSRSTSDLIGLVQGLDEDSYNGIVGVGVAMHPAVWGKGWPIEAVVLFVNLLFEVHGYRKLYCEMSDPTRRLLGSAMSRWMRPVARFAEHERVDDGYVDWHIYSLHRRDWDGDLARLVTGGRVVGAEQRRN